MIRQLPLVLVFLAFAVAPQARGSEPEVTPIVRFGDPADAVRITLARASLSRVTGTRVNAGGIAARVDFELADWPELVIRPSEEPADWSGMRALALPVDNPTAEPIDLVIRVDDNPHADGNRHSLTGRARLRSTEAGMLILPLPTNDALPMGMVAGPPAAAPRLDAPAQVIGGARGAVERRHVTAIHLILLRRSLGRTLIFGDPGIIRGDDPGPEAYRSIVDGFGQYTRAHWDGKIGSDELKHARLREEQELREGPPPPLALDRYGGLLEGPFFGATGFFAQSGGMAVGGLSHLMATAFSRSGSMSWAQISGPHLSRDGSSCSQNFPALAILWPRITATGMNAEACPKSEADISTMGAVSTSTPLICSGNMGQTIYRSGARPRLSGCAPGASTPLATGASPSCSNAARWPMSCPSTYTE
jgi:hypothetical protein